MRLSWPTFTVSEFLRNSSGNQRKKKQKKINYSYWKYLTRPINIGSIAFATPSLKRTRNFCSLHSVQCRRSISSAESPRYSLRLNHRGPGPPFLEALGTSPVMPKYQAASSFQILFFFFFSLMVSYFCEYFFFRWSCVWFIAVSSSLCFNTLRRRER